MNISDIYDVQDCLRNADIRTYNCGYFPVGINRPKEIISIYGLAHNDLPYDASILNCVISLKLSYAIQVLVMAIGVFKRKYSNPFEVKWIPLNESFNRLTYTKNRANLNFCVEQSEPSSCK